jgi:hypothetical protein
VRENSCKCKYFVIIISDNATETGVKRGRGRPRKIPLSEVDPKSESHQEKLSGGEENLESTRDDQTKTETPRRTPKKRGRKRKVKAEEDSEEYDTEQSGEGDNRAKSLAWESVQTQFLTLVIQSLSAHVCPLFICSHFVCLFLSV